MLPVKHLLPQPLAATFKAVRALLLVVSTASLGLSSGCADEGTADTSAAGGGLPGKADDGGACQYSGLGNELYRQAVESSRTYLRTPCEVLRYEVFESAQTAIKACPAVASLIATSPWAGDLRAVLGPLELGEMTGAFRDPMGADDGEAIAAALSEGQTFWAGSYGAYGPNMIVRFLPEGRYEVERLMYDEGRTPDISHEVNERGAFSVGVGTGATAIYFEADEESEEQLGALVIDRFAVDEWVSAFRLVDLGAWFDLVNEEADYEGPPSPARIAPEWLLNYELAECDA